jgi:transcriptional regulator with XRE-family HTH domain
MLPCVLIVLTGKHIRAARGLLGWSQQELSKRAKVGIASVRRMEDCEGPVAARTDTLLSVAGAIQKGGVEFLNDDRPGVRMKSPSKH